MSDSKPEMTLRWHQLWKTSHCRESCSAENSRGLLRPQRQSDKRKDLNSAKNQWAWKRIPRLNDTVHNWHLGSSFVRHRSEDIAEQCQTQYMHVVFSHQIYGDLLCVNRKLIWPHSQFSLIHSNFFYSIALTTFHSHSHSEFLNLLAQPHI